MVDVAVLACVLKTTTGNVYTVHLRLIGKRVVDVLFVSMELFR